MVMIRLQYHLRNVHTFIKLWCNIEISDLYPVDHKCWVGGWCHLIYVNYWNKISRVVVHKTVIFHV